MCGGGDRRQQLRRATPETAAAARRPKNLIRFARHVAYYRRYNGILVFRASAYILFASILSSPHIFLALVIAVFAVPFGGDPSPSADGCRCASLRTSRLKPIVRDALSVMRSFIASGPRAPARDTGFHLSSPLAVLAKQHVLHSAESREHPRRRPPSRWRRNEKRT